MNKGGGAMPTVYSYKEACEEINKLKNTGWNDTCVWVVLVTPKLIYHIERNAQLNHPDRPKQITNPAPGQEPGTHVKKTAWKESLKGPTYEQTKIEGGHAEEILCEKFEDIKSEEEQSTRPIHKPTWDIYISDSPCYGATDGANKTTYADPGSYALNWRSGNKAKSTKKEKSWPKTCTAKLFYLAGKNPAYTFNVYFKMNYGVANNIYKDHLASCNAWTEKMMQERVNSARAEAQKERGAAFSKINEARALWNEIDQLAAQMMVTETLTHFGKVKVATRGHELIENMHIHPQRIDFTETEPIYAKR
jgi:hypothetical protein